MQRRLYARGRAINIWLMAPLMGVAVFVAVFVSMLVPPAQAATSSYLNFQARLFGNNGTVVADGTYNIEFKLYNADGSTGPTQGTCTGNANCLWVETRTGGNKVQVINGYFSVNLGSVTAFPATINWDQPLYLTMNIGGTGASPVWDGEMQNSGHSIALTALPYSFIAGQLAKTDSSGNRGTLSFGSVTNNPVISLPNETGTVCTTASSGVCNTAGGLSNVAYLNQTQTFTGTNTFQPSTDVSSLIVKQTSSGTVSHDIFDVQTADTTKLIQISSTAPNVASLRLATEGSTASINLVNNGTGNANSAQITFSSSESRILIDPTGTGVGNYIDFFRNSNTTSARRFRIFQGNNTATEMFGVDASTGNVLMGNNLDLETAGSLTIGGNIATTDNLGSTTAASGSQTFNIGANATAGTYASTVNVGSNLNASTTTVKGGSGGINLSPSGVSNTGVLVKPGTDSTAAFQVQPASLSTPTLAVDTTNGRVGIDKTPAGGYNLDVQGSIGASSRLVINASNTNGGTLTKKTITGTGGVSANDVVVLNSSAQAVDTTTARDNRVYGVSLTTTVSGSAAEIALTGNITVNADTAAINVGDQVVTSTSSGRVTVDNGATTGILGVALTSKASGSNGTVDVALGQVRGQYNPVFRTNSDNSTAFQVQNASGNDLLSVDTSASQILFGTVSSVSGKLALASSGGGTISLSAGSTANSYSLVLPSSGPALGQCLQNDGTTIGQLTFGACGASGTFLNKNTSDTSTFTGLGAGAYGYTFTNSTSPANSSGVLSLDNGSNTGTVLSVKGTGSNALQVQNSSSQRVFGVDTSGKQAVLGQSSNVDGALLFQNHTSSYGITINSTNANSNYTLTLPTTAPAGGLCIETSPGDSQQLIFASCTNNNASIQEVHYWDANGTNAIPSVTPTTIGDEMVVTTQIPNAGVTVSGITGGGVTTWSKVVANNGNGTVNRVEMWVGTVASLTTSSITVNYSSTPSGEEVTATEFTAAGVNASTSWGIESSSSQLNSTASTTVTFPSATAVNGSELYVGYAQAQQPPVTAPVPPSTGFSYIQTSIQHNMVTYDTSLAANTTYQPTATQSSAGESNTVDAVLTAFVTSSSINNTTSLQKANFYVQAASANTVAGVLQAASSGTFDILDLKNSGAANVLSVSSAGDVTIQPAASTAALQVLNGSNYSVMAVDTSGNQVIVGDASHLSGKISFADSSDSNTISLEAPTSIATSYQLALPTNAPTPGLCLGTDPNNANQLIFASCATQVSAANISYVNKWSTTTTSLSDSPTSLGNLIVLFSHTVNNVSISGTPSGGGVTSWTKVTSDVGGTGQGNVEMWRGVVTAVGSGTISVSYSGTTGGDEITAVEFTMGSSTGTWAIDTSGTTAGTSATINYPSLTPINSDELYAGYAWSANTMTAGTNTGYSWLATAGSKYVAYDPNVTGGTPQQPTATQSSGTYNSIAALIEAYVGTSVIVNTTSTQQANFNVQAATNGTVAGVLQAAASGTADIFQAKDSSGNNVMTINTSDVNGVDGVTLGTSNSVGGELVFNAGSNSNTITIQAPSTPGTSYILKLPSAQAAPGQCLSASPSDYQQLVFSSCANQVTSVAISYVNGWKNSGNGVTTIPSVTPSAVGDLMVLFSSPRGSGSLDTSNPPTGGGVSVWSKITSTTAGSGADTTTIEMWKGVVTSTSTSSITVHFSGSTGNPNELAAMEFTTGSSTGSWVVDASNTLYNSSSSGVATWPSLTPQSSRDLYVGYGAAGSSFSGTGTSGFSFVSGSLSNREGLYNTNVSSATQPTANLSSSSTSLTIGALIAAYSSSSVISNSTVTQQANFNIQAATSTSVAGVLQAFPGSSQDILQIMNDVGTVVDSFGSSGNLLVRPSTASAAAFQVQNTSNANVLSVDTSAKQVVIGAGSTGESSVSLLVLDNQTGSSGDPTEVDGAMYYNAVTRTFRCGAAGIWQNCGGLLYANTSNSSPISNCSNNCAAFSTYASVPGGYCQAGRVIKLSASGFFSSQATASNLQFGLYYGSDNTTASNDTLLGVLSPAVSVTSASNNFFQTQFSVHCFSPTSMQSEGTLSLQTGSAGSGMTVVPMNSTSSGGTTVVSSSTQYLYIFPVWDTASSSNTTTITQFSVDGL